MENSQVDNASTGSTDSTTSYPSLQELANHGFEIDQESLESVPTEGSKTTDEIEQTETQRGNEMSIEDMLKQMEDGEEAETAEVEKAEAKDEAFVIKHNGETKSLSKDDVIEYAQKGFDYTQKTQALAEKEKDFEVKLQTLNSNYESKMNVLNESVAKHEQQLTEYSTLEFALAEMQEKDPELFGEVARYYQESEKLQNTPANKAMRSEMAKLKAQIDQLTQGNSAQSNQKEAELIREKFDTELGRLKESVFPKLNAVGIKVDIEKVKQAWIEGEASGLTVEQAFNAVYGGQIRKVYDSKLKVNRLENKGRSRSAIATSGTGKTSGNGGIGGLSWNQIEQGGWRNLI